MSELKPCPFCGGEAELVPTRETTVREWFVTCGNLECNVLACLTNRYYTEAEAIAAWNTRAPVEYDDWFYLPKPDENFVQYGTPRIEKTEIGYRVEQPVEVIEDTLLSWSNQLGDHIMKHLCEVWIAKQIEDAMGESVFERIVQMLEQHGYVKVTRCKDCKYSIDDDPLLCGYPDAKYTVGALFIYPVIDSYGYCHRAVEK